MSLCPKCKTEPRAIGRSYCPACLRAYNREKSAERRARGDFDRFHAAHPDYMSNYMKSYELTPEQVEKQKQAKKRYEQTPKRREAARIRAAKLRAEKKNERG